MSLLNQPQDGQDEPGSSSHANEGSSQNFASDPTSIELNQLSPPTVVPEEPAHLSHGSSTISTGSNLNSPQISNGNGQNGAPPNPSPSVHVSQSGGANAQIHDSHSPPPVANGISAPSNNIPGPVPREWKSRWLRTPTMLVMISTTAILIGVVIGLCVWSRLKHGITRVNLTNQHKLFNIPDLEIGISLAWTIVPVFIAQVYVLTIAALVKAASTRQPYIELRKFEQSDRGAAAEKSIFLDYQAYLAIRAPVEALKRDHYMLSFSFSATLLSTLILTAFTSHLFFTKNFPLARDITVRQVHIFDDLSFGARSDLTSVLDVVAATRIYGGRPLPWTTLRESVLPVSLGQVESTQNLSIRTEAYSITLDCKVLQPPYEFAFGHTSQGWQFNVADRGCGLSNQTFTEVIVRYVVDYIFTYTTVSCGPEANYSRMIVVAGLSRNPTHLTTHTWDDSVGFKNVTAVSCIPTYYLNSGLLSMSVDPTRPQDPNINGFTSTVNLVTSRPGFANSFETQINQGGILDSVRTVYESNFGRLIYTYAKQLSPASYFEGEVLSRAMQDLVASTFAVMANLYLVQPGSPSHIDGTIYLNETRLIVVLSVACIIVVMLTTVLVMLIWIYLYSKKHASIQYEDSIGLLGAAAILKQSDLISDIDTIAPNTCTGGPGRVAEEFRKEAQSRRPPQGWRFDQWSNPSQAKLKRTTQTESFGFPLLSRQST